MDTFLLTMLLVFGCAQGARDQMLIAQLSDASARALPLLVLAITCASISAAALAFFGATIAHILPSRAGQMLVAFALVAAAIELVWPVKVKPMKEPTRSLGAITFVLFARQLGDGPRFIVFAFAASASFAQTAALGGALGGAGALALGWFVGERGLSKIAFQYLRPVLGACLFIAAVFIGLNARYTIW